MKFQNLIFHKNNSLISVEVVKGTTVTPILVGGSHYIILADPITSEKSPNNCPPKPIHIISYSYGKFIIHT